MKLIQTNPNDKGVMLLRLALGTVMFTHGAQKALGWWGGHGWSGTMSMFTRQMHIPPVFAALAILAEFAGGLGLITGLLTRPAAFGIATNMVVAVFVVHAPNSPVMQWFGGDDIPGLEYHVLAVAIALVVLSRGGGAASIDAALGRTEPKHQAPAPRKLRAA